MAQRAKRVLSSQVRFEVASPSQRSEQRSMRQTQIEIVGKVIVVVGGKRKCLICDGVFTPTQAAEHATAPCCVEFNGSSDKSVC